MAETLNASNAQSDQIVAQLRQAASDGFTGELSVGDHGSVFCNGGRIVVAELPGSPSVAALLFASGYRPLEKVEDVADHTAAVAELVDAGSDESKATLWRLAWEQSLGVLFELSLAEATLQRRPDTLHPLAGVLGFSIDELLVEVDARRAVWQRIAARIPSIDAVFRMADTLGAPERVVAAEEWRILAQLDGRNSVSDVITTTGNSAFRVCSVLYRLLLDEVITEV